MESIALYSSSSTTTATSFSRFCLPRPRPRPAAAHLRPIHKSTHTRLPIIFASSSAAAAPIEGELKHIVLAKFKDGLSEQQIDEYIKDYANLVNLVPSLKAFRWGKDVSIGNRHQGFTHVFELIFESTQGIAEYTSHPNHVDFANRVLPQLEKLLAVDYKPTKVLL